MGTRGPWLSTEGKGSERLPTCQSGKSVAVPRPDSVAAALALSLRGGRGHQKIQLKMREKDGGG